MTAYEVRNAYDETASGEWYERHFDLMGIDVSICASDRCSEYQCYYIQFNGKTVIKRTTERKMFVLIADKYDEFRAGN